MDTSYNQRAASAGHRSDAIEAAIRKRSENREAMLSQAEVDALRWHDDFLTAARIAREEIATASPVIGKIDADSFDETVRNCPTPAVILDLYAYWCGPCRSGAPRLNQLAEELKGRLTIFKADFEDDPRLAKRFRVTTFPALLLFYGGGLSGYRCGIGSLEEMRAWVEPFTVSGQA